MGPLCRLSPGLAKTKQGYARKVAPGNVFLHFMWAYGKLGTGNG